MIKLNTVEQSICVKEEHVLCLARGYCELSSKPHYVLIKLTDGMTSFSLDYSTLSAANRAFKQVEDALSAND